MKTVNDIKKDIAELTKEINELNLSDLNNRRIIKRLESKLSILKECHLYMKTCPSHEFIKSEISRLETRIKEIMKYYEPLNDKIFLQSEITKHRAVFEKTWGLPKIKKQLQFLKYLNQ